MGLKKRSKVSAEFSMSSLTDIIFLLLIFFMLTSSLVAPNALNLKLPGSSRNTSSVPKKLDDVRISASGNFYFNGKRSTIGQLEKTLGSRARATKYTITISPSDDAPIESVIAVMDIGLRYDINTVLAAAEE